MKEMRAWKLPQLIIVRVSRQANAANLNKVEFTADQNLLLKTEDIYMNLPLIPKIESFTSNLLVNYYTMCELCGQTTQTQGN